MATIRKRGSSWHVQVRKQGHPNLTRSFQSKRAAEVWSRELERASDFGELPLSMLSKENTKNLGELLDRYLKEVTSIKRGVAQEQFLVRALIRSPLSQMNVAAVTPSVVSKFRDRRLREVKSSTVSRELAVLSHCFEIGRKEWGVDVFNPVKGIRLPNPSKARDGRLAASEQKLFDDASSKSRTWYLRPLVTLAVETGMRRGELLGLEWNDVRFDLRTATLPLTKNGSSRVVPLTPNAIATLKGLPLRGKLIFPVKPACVHQAWQRVVTKASLFDFRFHDLRHEAISRFFEIGLSVAEVAFISGHKDVRMLFRYTHMKADHVLKRLESASA